MKTTYIYVKQAPSGLLYLGKTVKDIKNNPSCYIGSGKYWKLHLKSNQYTYKDIKTWILYETNNEEDLINMGVYYSKLFDVVNSDRWANLKEEDGTGGDTSQSKTKEQYKDIAKKVVETRRKNNSYLTSDETKIKQRLAKLGKPGPWKDKKRTHDCKAVWTDELKQKVSLNRKGKKQTIITCEYCGKTGGLNTMKQRHRCYKNPEASN